MGDIRDISKRPRSTKKRDGRPDPDQWRGNQEMQEYIADVSFGTQDDMVELCKHSAFVRIGEAEATKVMEDLVHQMWMAFNGLDITIAQALLGTDGVRADLMRHLVEQTAYTAVTQHPSTALGHLFPGVKQAVADAIRSGNLPDAGKATEQDTSENI